MRKLKRNKLHVTDANNNKKKTSDLAQIKKVIGTWTSPVVSHLSTTQAWRCLTSQIKRDVVHSA